MALTGQGCQLGSQTDVKTGKPSIGASIDAAVRAMFGDSDEVDKTQADEAGDASVTSSDKVEIDAYGEASYDLK